MNAASAMAMAAPDVRVETAVHQPEWDAYVAAHPAQTSCHLWAWRDVFQHAFGRESTYLAARGAGGRLVGVLPVVWFDHPLFGRFGVSMPFLNYGGVLADDPHARAVLMAAAQDACRAREASYLELRHTMQVFPDLPCKTHKVAMRLSLQASEEAQWERLDRKVRNQVRKADKNDLTVVRGGAELVGEFYTVFARNMRDLGTPVYARRFFDEVCARFPDRTAVFSVRWQGIPIAGSLVFAHGGTVEVPWASSLREHNHLCANIRLYWEMVRHAVASGATTFDFGRSTPHEGTFHFKRQWGADAHAVHWEYWMRDSRPLPDLSPRNAKYRTVIGAWQRLPLWLANALGPSIVRHIP